MDSRNQSNEQDFLHSKQQKTSKIGQITLNVANENFVRILRIRDYSSLVANEEEGTVK